MKIQSNPSEKTPVEGHRLLLEIGVEEIPSNVLPQALRQLPELAKKYFTESGLSFSEAQVYGTPRRLILFVSELAASQETKEEIIVGPPKRAAYDKNGLPTKAAEGFAKSQGRPLSELKIEDAVSLGASAKGKKGEYLVLRKTRVGEQTAVLLETLLPQIIGGLSFPRAMRWNESKVSFIRPIRWILALYGENVVPFSFAGVKSGDQTQGHRIMSPGAFQATDFEQYQSELAGRFVIIDPKKRIRLITSQMKTLAKEKKGGLFFSSERGESLLEKAACTVEYPKAICGGFDDDFLVIPKEIIATAMAEHQGYFPISGKGDELLPHFITILNIDSEDLSLIRKGNERVLSARLQDARFYFDQDRQQKLDSFFKDLEQITFQEKLGSVAEKAVRLEALSLFIAEKLDCGASERDAAKRAAHLSKCDLLTGVVREFTSLQGTMGRIYATCDGESSEIAEAIEEQYLPKQAGGDLPKTKLGRILSIADKLDTLVGCFVGDLKSSGSEDPYAIRRQALGMILILLSDQKLQSLSLDELIKEAIFRYAEQGVDRAIDKKKDIQDGVSAFLKIRLDTHLSSKNIPPDLRTAILFAGNIDNPADLVARAQALLQFSKDPLFEPLMMAFKRAIRILPPDFEGGVKPALFKEAAEQNLYDKVSAIQKDMRPLWEARQYVAVLACLSGLFEPLNHFFDEVMVMDQDEKIRQNRLSLLFEIQQQFKPFGDFSKIVSSATGA